MKRIIIASGPVIVKDRKVLLDKHGDDSFWKFCGGRVEDDTYTLIENAQRKAFEEMGIEIEILNDKPFIMHTIKEVAPEGRIDILLVHYLAKKLNEIAPGKDIREWKWIPLEDLEKEDLAPNIVPTLKHFGFIK